MLIPAGSRYAESLTFQQLAEFADAGLLEEFRVVNFPTEPLGDGHQHFYDLHRAATGIEEIVEDIDMWSIQLFAPELLQIPLIGGFYSEIGIVVHVGVSLPGIQAFSVSST
jgi:hypothetical protein